MMTSEQSPETNQKARKLVSMLDRMQTDANFRSELAEDNLALLREMDVSVPNGMSVKVVANTSQLIHVVLPPDPNASLEDEWLEVLQAGAGSWSDRLQDVGEVLRTCGVGSGGSSPAYDNLNMSTSLFSISLSGLGSVSVEMDSSAT